MNQSFLHKIIENLKSATMSSVNTLKDFHTPNSIQFATNERRIEIREIPNANIFSSFNCQFPDDEELKTNWHQILIHHKNKYTKNEILDAFFEILGDVLFLPIAYRRGMEIDYFFLRNQKEALKKLFDHKLEITVKGDILELLVKLGVGVYEEKQLNPIDKFTEVIKQRIKKSTRNGSQMVLDLDNIAEDPLLQDICVNLGNVGTLSFFFRVLNSFDKIKQLTPYRIFKFANNKINALTPFKNLCNFQMDVIDLSNNNIEDIEQLSNLEHLMALEIFIEGNGCNTEQNIEKVRSRILKKLKKIDNIVIFKTPTLYQTNVRGEAIRVGNNPIRSSSIRDGIIIKSNNRASYLKNFFNLRKEECWSKVIVYHNDNYTSDQILMKIAREICHNVPFYPCYLKRFKGRDEFFLYKNFDALKLIFQNELKVRMSQLHDDVFNVQLCINVADFEDDQIDWSENIKYVITHRIINYKLILNDFLKDPLLANIYICMSSNNTQIFILEQARLLTNLLTEMHFENCGFTHLEGFAVILNAFTKLKVLNLRNNLIYKLDGIKNSNNITEVILDGNPVCNKKTLEYLRYVQEFFPQIQYIDGTRYNSETKMITFTNYLVTMDIYTIVDEFIKHFFSIWDSFERNRLIQMYTKNAMLSFCIDYGFDRANETLTFDHIYPRVQNLVAYDHNIMKLSDMSRASKKVHIGENIGQFLNDFPRTRHDLSTFCIDVPYYYSKKSQMVIIVSGMVEDLTSDKPFLFAFSRTFTLVSKNSEFFITNDQLLFRNPSKLQRDAFANNAFAASNYEDLVENCRQLLPNEMEEKTLKLIMLQELTHCKKDYCLKLLEEKFWDFKVALACFTIELNENKIPDNCFNV